MDVINYCTKIPILNPLLILIVIICRVINCMCMGRFDASGTSKNDNSPKVLVGHGVKKIWH